MTARQRALVRAPAAGAAIAYLVGAPVEVVAAIAVIVGALPATVTFVVTRGGLFGLARTILHGTPKD